MSVQAMTWALDHSRSRGSTLLVLIAIASHAGKCGEESWAGMKTIGKAARVSRNTVISAVAELEDLGEVFVYPGKGVPGRGGTTHRYELPLVAGWSAPYGLKPRKTPNTKTSSTDTSLAKDVQSLTKEARSEAERGSPDCARTVLTEPSTKTAADLAVVGNPATDIRRRHLAPKPLRVSA